MRSSSTGFAAWRSSTAARCSCSRATASRSGATFPSSRFPPGVTCSTARSSCATPTGARTSTHSASAFTPRSRASNAWPARRRPSYVAFDLLAHEQDSLLELPFAERRAALEGLLAGEAFARAPVELMPTAGTPEDARQWLEHAEGAIAKERSAPYRPGERKGMAKVKRVRTIDAVLVGWRPGKEPGTVGALILGLYDGPELRVVGHCSGLSAAEKRRLVGFFAPYETGERGSADPSRWSAGKDLEWVALRPELVVEIDFDHVSAGRIRHGAKLRRWREDKDPQQCHFDQLTA